MKITLTVEFDHANYSDSDCESPKFDTAHVVEAVLEDMNLDRNPTLTVVGNVNVSLDGRTFEEYKYRQVTEAKASKAKIK